MIKGRGLYPSAEKCGLNVGDKTHVTKDYRKILEQKDVDVVTIATARPLARAHMAIDAMEAGKDVYMEKPMTKTIAEAIAVVDCAVKNNRVVTVGVAVDGRPEHGWQPTSTSRLATLARFSRGRRVTTATPASASGATTR